MKNLAKSIYDILAVKIKDENFDEIDLAAEQKISTKNFFYTLN